MLSQNKRYGQSIPQHIAGSYFPAAPKESQALSLLCHFPLYGVECPQGGVHVPGKGNRCGLHGR